MSSPPRKRTKRVGTLRRAFESDEEDQEKAFCHKREFGQFMTPVPLASLLVDELCSKLVLCIHILLASSQQILFLDPCCGDGQLIKALFLKIVQETNIDMNKLLERAWLNDLDSSMLDVARAELSKMGDVNNTCFTNVDALSINKRVAVIITNPPWRSCRNGESAILRTQFPYLPKGQLEFGRVHVEHYVRNLMLEEHGFIAAIMPASILEGEATKPFRRRLLDGSLHYCKKHKFSQKVSIESALLVWSAQQPHNDHVIGGLGVAHQEIVSDPEIPLSEVSVRRRKFLCQSDRFKRWSDIFDIHSMAPNGDVHCLSHSELIANHGLYPVWENKHIPLCAKLPTQPSYLADAKVMNKKYLDVAKTNRRLVVGRLINTIRNKASILEPGQYADYNTTIWWAPAANYTLEACLALVVSSTFRALISDHLRFAGYAALSNVPVPACVGEIEDLHSNGIRLLAAEMTIEENDRQVAQMYEDASV